MPKLDKLRDHIPDNSSDKFNQLVFAYKGLKEKEKELAKRISELRSKIDSFAEENYDDFEISESGSFYKTIELPGGSKVVFERRRVVRTKYLDHAPDVLRRHGLDDCIQTTETIRTDLLKQAAMEERISIEELEGIVEENSSYAIYLNKAK